MYETPIVVIIAAVPGTLRRGRKTVRSMATPSKPQNNMTPTRANKSVPASGNPVRTARCPTRPVIFRIHMEKNEPTMNTLKWAKLMSSMMP